MAIIDVADQYFTYESRLASFQTAQQVSKRRTSNANSKGPKSTKWPHKFLAPEELAKAGFFYYPLQAYPDNVSCFLCHNSLDGWEKGDDPLAEHLKHSPACGWAIVATIERQDGELSEEDPSSARMIEARKATFADKWPHENKKGWKCKIKQMVDAGWKYTPTPEYDDMATCTYCSLALDGWEPSDKPMDEHLSRSPECPFFALIRDHKPGPAAKRTKAKKDRSSKSSRLSTQSVLTTTSDAPSLPDLPAEEEDSILTTATNATATHSEKKMGKGKKATAAKGRKTKAKKSEPIEVAVGPEPEDDDFEVKVEIATKPTRGRKRKSEEINDSTASAIEVEEPPAKRRTTRTRGSIAVDTVPDVEGDTNQAVTDEGSKSRGSRTRGRPSRARSTRKASTATVTSPTAPVPNDEELDAALRADLDRPLTDDEETHAATPPRKATRSSKIIKADHAMLEVKPVDIDEAAIEAELEAMEAESKPLPKTKGAKVKQPRKASAKQQAAAKKAAEAEIKAQQAVEEEPEQQIASEPEQQIVSEPEQQIASEPEQQIASEPEQQIASEPEHSISIQHSPPIDHQKKQQAPSPQLPRESPARARSSTPPPKEMTPSQSPQSSDIENQPPSLKQSAIVNKAATPHSNTPHSNTPHSNATRIPLAASTPVTSPSKRNVIACLQSVNPWTAVDIDDIFQGPQDDENLMERGVLGDVIEKVKNGELTSPEKKMTVEEWIHYNAEMAEEKLRNECERMVGAFEREGTRAMRALEGIECID